MKKQDKLNAEFIQSSTPREVLLQYPTYSVWKRSSEVTLDEWEKYGTGQQKWGNSDIGIVIEIMDSDHSKGNTV